MNDMHQQYLDEGETIYGAQLDSVSAAPGDKRIELELFALAQRIEKVRIYWNDLHDSLDVAIGNQTGIFKQIISNLPEGEYIFNLVSFDKFGNKSLKYELTSQVYGEAYVSGLLNRGISEIKYEEEDLVINWRTAANILGTSLSYQNATGDTSEVFIPASESTTTILDYKNDGAYWYQTLYKPVENAIDTFKTEAIHDVFPHYVKYVVCDKSLFAEMSLPNDLGRLGWDDNERMERLWDGSVGSQSFPWIFHSDGSTLPGVITFDMGRVYDNLAIIEETGRDCCGNPLVFEVWGIDDISEAVTELHPRDDGWSDEAISKGWTLLKEVVRTDDGKAAFKVNLNDNLPPVRYIRLRFKQSYEGTDNVNLSEVTFWNRE
jgi:hypothetical protein